MLGRSVRRAAGRAPITIARADEYDGPRLTSAHVWKHGACDGDGTEIIHVKDLSVVVVPANMAVLLSACCTGSEFPHCDAGKKFRWAKSYDGVRELLKQSKRRRSGIIYKDIDLTVDRYTFVNNRFDLRL